MRHSPGAQRYAHVRAGRPAVSQGFYPTRNLARASGRFFRSYATLELGASLVLGRLGPGFASCSPHRANTRPLQLGVGSGPVLPVRYFSGLARAPEGWQCINRGSHQHDDLRYPWESADALRDIHA